MGRDFFLVSGWRYLGGCGCWWVGWCLVGSSVAFGAVLVVVVVECVGASVKPYWGGWSVGCVELGGLVWAAPRGGYVPRPNARDGWWGMVLGVSGGSSGYSTRITSYGCKSRCVVGCRCEGGSAGAWVCVGCDGFGCVR